MFGNWQGINPMRLSTPLEDYIKKIFTNTRFSPTTLYETQKLSRDLPNGPLFPLYQILFSQVNKSTKLIQ